jgi:hypothetical protein
VRSLETHRPRFVEIVPPTLFPFSKEAKYEEVNYNTGGARQKDSQRPGLVVDRAAQERREQVSQIKRQEAQTNEQWATIQSVKQTIGPGSSNHHYEVPNFPQHLERSPKQQEYEQRRGSHLQEEYEQGTGNRRFVHRGLQDLRVETPLPQTRYVENVKERVMSKGHLFTPSSASTPRRDEARALTPDHGTNQSENWEQEMIRNINQISITGGLTRLQNESFLLQKQEEKRVQIQQQLAHIQTLNHSINLEVTSNHGSLEDDQEIDDLENIICSTDPGLLSKDYNTRLELMRSVQLNLGQVLMRKSRRLQNMQAEQVNTQGLNKREKQNLEY